MKRIAFLRVRRVRADGPKIPFKNLNFRLEISGWDATEFDKLGDF